MQKLEKLQTEMYHALQKVFGESTMSQTAMFQWYQLFQDGHESVDNEPCSGHLSSTHTADLVGRVREVVNMNR